MTAFKDILNTIVSDELLHAKWLNTLSMMENTGARKISASEHKSKVTLVVLKHAAEEARHAYYLKKQIAKIDAELCPDYSHEHLLSPWHSMAYLNMLDVELCRYLKKNLGLEGYDLKFGAYLLVTYAIEVRADELYPVYQEVLTTHQSRINVKSIIAEEETHLAEMQHQMKTFFSDWETEAKKAAAIESGLFNNWVKELSEELCVAA
jgi:hypothetical protein